MRGCFVSCKACDILVLFECNLTKFHSLVTMSKISIQYFVSVSCISVKIVLSVFGFMLLFHTKYGLGKLIQNKV